MRKMKNNGGMTLLEVLIALAVFALAGGAVVHAVMNTVLGINNLEEAYMAQMVADNVIAEYRLTQRWPNDGWVSSKIDMANKTWYYRYRGHSTQDADFKSFEVEVFNNAKISTSTPVATLRTYISR